MSVVFIGTPSFAVPCLRRLSAGEFNVTIVITQPDRPAGRGQQPRPSAVKIAAQELALPVLQPDTLRDAEVLTSLSALEPDVIVAVAYGQILRRELLDIPKRGVLNVHPSLLPRWRGASPIPAAILAGDEKTGVTIMLMDEGMDSGPIVAQREIPIEPSDNAETLSERLSELGADLLTETLPLWLRDEILPALQDAAAATKSPLLRKQDGEIDWSLPADDIWRRVRAYNPWPGAYTMLGDDAVRIWQAQPLEIESGQDAGYIFELQQSQTRELPEGVGAAIAVQTGAGTLAVLRLQRSGRRTLPTDEFLRGIRDGLVGRRFGSHS